MPGVAFGAGPGVCALFGVNECCAAGVEPVLTRIA